MDSFPGPNVETCRHHRKACSRRSLVGSWPIIPVTQRALFRHNTAVYKNSSMFSCSCVCTHSHTETCGHTDKHTHSDENALIQTAPGTGGGERHKATWAACTLH